MHQQRTSANPSTSRRSPSKEKRLSSGSTMVADMEVNESTVNRVQTSNASPAVDQVTDFAPSSFGQKTVSDTKECDTKQSEEEDDDDDNLVVPAWPSRSETISGASKSKKNEFVQHKVYSLKDYSQVASPTTIPSQPSANSEPFPSGVVLAPGSCSSSGNKLLKSMSQDRKVKASSKRMSECIYSTSAAPGQQLNPMQLNPSKTSAASGGGYLFQESRIDRMRKLFVSPLSLRSSSQQGQAGKLSMGGQKPRLSIQCEPTSQKSGHQQQYMLTAMYRSGQTALLPAAAATSSSSSSAANYYGSRRSPMRTMNNKVGKAGKAQQGAAGKSFRVYGCPLQMANNIYPITCFGRPDIYKQQSVPYILARLCNYIEENSSHLKHEGIFRVSGNARLMEKLRTLFDHLGDAPLESESVDVATSASMLKMYLRELPEPLIPTRMNYYFITLAKKYSLYLNNLKEYPSMASSGSSRSSLASSSNRPPTKSSSSASATVHHQSTQFSEERSSQQTIQSERQRLAFSRDLTKLVRKLPIENYNLLKYLACFLYRISLKQQYNKMCAEALGIVFGPNIFRIRSENYKGLKEQELSNQIMASIISNYKSIFDSDVTDPLGNIIELDKPIDAGAPINLIPGLSTDDNDPAAVASTSKVAINADAVDISLGLGQIDKPALKADLAGDSVGAVDLRQVAGGSRSNDNNSRLEAHQHSSNTVCCPEHCQNCQLMGGIHRASDDDDDDDEGESYTPSTGSGSYCSSMNDSGTLESSEEDEEDEEYDDNYDDELDEDEEEEEDEEDEDDLRDKSSSGECGSDTSYTPTSSHSESEGDDGQDGQDGDESNYNSDSSRENSSVSANKHLAGKRQQMSACVRCRRRESSTQTMPVQLVDTLDSKPGNTDKLVDDEQRIASKIKASDMVGSAEAVSSSAVPEHQHNHKASKRKAGLRTNAAATVATIEGRNLLQPKPSNGRFDFMKRRSSSASSLSRIRRHHHHRTNRLRGQGVAESRHSAESRRVGRAFAHEVKGRQSRRSGKRSQHQQQATKSSATGGTSCKANKNSINYYKDLIKQEYDPIQDNVSALNLAHDGTGAEFGNFQDPQLLAPESFYNDKYCLLRSYNSDETLLQSSSFKLNQQYPDSLDPFESVKSRRRFSTHHDFILANENQQHQRLIACEQVFETCMEAAELEEVCAEPSAGSDDQLLAATQMLANQLVSQALASAMSHEIAPEVEVTATDDGLAVCGPKQKSSNLIESSMEDQRTSEAAAEADDILRVQLNVLRKLILILKRQLKAGLQVGYSEETRALIERLSEVHDAELAYSNDYLSAAIDYLSADSIIDQLMINDSLASNVADVSSAPSSSASMQLNQRLNDILNLKIKLLKQLYIDLKRVREHYFRNHHHRRQNDRADSELQRRRRSNAQESPAAAVEANICQLAADDDDDRSNRSRERKLSAPSRVVVTGAVPLQADNLAAPAAKLDSGGADKFPITGELSAQSLAAGSENTLEASSLSSAHTSQQDLRGLAARPEAGQRQAKKTNRGSFKQQQGCCRYGSLCPIEFVFNIERQLAHKRLLGDRNLKVNDMSLEQLQCEKLELQKNLLRYEHWFGRPINKLDYSLVGHLYERYRAIKLIKMRKSRPA